MVEHDEPPADGAFVAICFIGVVVGFTAMVLWLFIGVFVYSKPFWIAFPLYMAFGAVGALATSLLIAYRAGAVDDSSVASRQNLSGDRRASTDRGSLCMVGGNGHDGPRRRVIASQKIHYDEKLAKRLGANLCDASIGDRSDNDAEETFVKPSPSVSLSDKLFDPKRHASQRSFWTADTAVAYFGGPGLDNFPDISSWANQNREALVTLSPGEANWNVIQSLLDETSLCFVDSDAMGDLEDTVDLCLRLRNCAPEVHLILISSEVRGHDLTAERAAICDATLKSPLTERAIDAGVSAASNNFVEKFVAPFSPLRKKGNGPA
ncbi:hypothetical protein [uncultured Tateyamaria sp.]|uniref:hypothetical protein n=1 Tax=uncultured Tateyamaria sp. TaxID=455651 RepID=UPI0026350AA5|nr:hypothetical protein [uncultured Tateyamaria sp.]